MTNNNAQDVQIKAFFDPDTYTMTYVVHDTATKDAVVIDPVLDYDPKASKTSIGSVVEVAKFIDAQKLNLHAVIETHAHADHLSGSQYFVKKYGVKIAIGEYIKTVQEVFKNLFDLPPEFNANGSQFDILFKDGEIAEFGSLRFEIIHTPGHTPACTSIKIGDAIFTGDLLFMHDYGTGRCDFPAGSSADMYESVQKLYQLPDETRVFVGHDYQPGGREPRWETTIGQSKQQNPQINAKTTKEEFVAFRDSRDKTLAAPRLLFQSVQVNIDAGHLPPPSKNNQIRYLKIPVNVFRGAEQKGIDDPYFVNLMEDNV
jgi:glyoxylase-like metal-dependent hydrolase (beta-lactamase superfamily II)